MDAFLELSLLYEYYGALLTDMQKMICDLYYNQNLTLTEIAEDLGITKQGVRDALKKSEKLLYKYEDALHVQSKNNQLGELVQKIISLLNDSTISDTEKKKMSELAEQINSLI